MGFFDYIWIVRLIIEILKIIAAMDEPERLKIANLRSIMPDIPDDGPKKAKPPKP